MWAYYVRAERWAEDRSMMRVPSGASYAARLRAGWCAVGGGRCAMIYSANGRVVPTLMPEPCPSLSEPHGLGRPQQRNRVDYSYVRHAVVISQFPKYKTVVFLQGVGERENRRRNTQNN